MEYKPLQTMNPANADLTVNHSIWLCSRLMPGKGNLKSSFPHYRVINNTGMRLGDIYLDGIIAMNDSEDLIDVMGNIYDIEWKGIWTSNNQPIIGECSNAKGLITPFNMFNVGYRYKQNWRPRK